MAEKTTLARPYAQAAFEIARSQGALARWSETLHYAAAIGSHDDVRSLIGNPRVKKGQLMQLILDIGGAQFDEKAQNFLRLLAENDRLGLLPEIAALYETLRAEAERKVEAQVVSAYPLDDAQQNQIVVALKRRLGREVALKASVDPLLVGGAIIRAGDLVIDGSVNGHLANLTAALSR